MKRLCLAVVLLGALGGQLPDAQSPPDLLQQMAEDPNPAVRRAVARSIDLTSELLTQLAEDPHPGVRREVARHPSATLELLAQLAEDQHPGVRAEAVLAMFP